MLFLQAQEEFLVTMEAEGKRGSTLNYYRLRISWLWDRIREIRGLDGAVDFQVGSIDPESEVYQVLMTHEKMDGRKLSQSGRLAYWRGISRFLRWCELRTYCSFTPQEWAIMKIRGKGKMGKGFLAVEEVEKLLKHGGKYRWSYILSLYAGVRVEEVRGSYGKPPLLFSAVQKAERRIVIPPEIAKTGESNGKSEARVITLLPETFWELWKDAPTEGVICPSKTFSPAQIAGKKILGRWSKNCLRHTFATYHVEAFANPGLTVSILGHGTDLKLLGDHYRGNRIEYRGKEYYSSESRAQRFFFADDFGQRRSV